MTDLVDGLHALELLARLAPIDTESFARAGEIDVAAAAELIGIYTATGFVRRVPHGSLVVLTPIALARVFTHNLVGNLVTRGIERIGDVSGALGDACVTLSVRRGAQMMCVLTSTPGADRLVGERTDMLDCVEGQVHAAFSGDRKFGKADAIREAGFGFGGERDSATLAVPVLVQGRPVAVLAGHFQGAPPPRTAFFVLQAAAHELLNASAGLRLVLSNVSATVPAALH